MGDKTRTPYEILGLTKKYTNKDLKKAYLSKAKIWHPDKNPKNVKKATKEFQYIQQSYDILKNISKKNLYDTNKNNFGFKSNYEKPKQTYYEKQKKTKSNLNYPEPFNISKNASYTDLYNQNNIDQYHMYNINLNVKENKFQKQENKFQKQKNKFWFNSNYEKNNDTIPEPFTFRNNYSNLYSDNNIEFNFNN